MLILVLRFALALAPAADAGVEIRASVPSAVIIWGGGAARADAERWRAAFESTQAAFRELFTLRPGYPRVVESASMPGLKPGFFVVVLGVCPLSESAARVNVFKGLSAGTYTRLIDGSQARDACPILGARVNVERSQSIQNRDALLTMSQWQTPSGELLRATLISRRGAFLGTKSFQTPSRAFTFIPMRCSAFQ